MPDSTVTVIGNVAREPELRYTQGGSAVCNFSVAVNRKWQNRTTQEWEEEVSFFDVACWRDLAENVADSIPKGARVLVTGRLEQQSWETDTGDKRSKVQIVADEVGPSLRWATAEIARNERESHVDPGNRKDTGNRREANGNVKSSSRGKVQPPAEEPW